MVIVMKKVLVLGDANSFWTKRVIENVMIPNGMSVTLITSTNFVFKDYYCTNKINVISTMSKNGLFAKFKIFRKIKSVIKFIFYYLFYKRDITHVHFGFYSTLRMISLLPKKYKLVITYWGSDLLRIPEQNLLKTKRAVDKADFISVGSEELLEKLEATYGKRILNKVQLIRMGISSIPAIESQINNRSAIKKEILGKYADRVAVMVGYNAAPNQQHIDVIKAIDLLDDSVKNKIVLLLPITYLRNNKEYLEKLEGELNRSSLNSVVFEKFMDEDEMAKLCLSVDLYINAQTTDAISATMLELICAGAKVINGNWLSYAFLDKNGIEYDTFDTFADLSSIIEKYISYDMSFAKTNRSIIKNEFSWTEIKRKWDKIYMELVR